jgi:hypothetical protein
VEPPLQFARDMRRLIVDDVPPGVYYLRVRVVNVTGSSVPSGELRVSVGGTP